MRGSPATPGQAEPPSALLRVAGLRVSHRGRLAERTILSGVDLHVDRGETVGIVGESGSGKSIFAKAVTRLLPRNVHAEGSVDFDGTDVLAVSDRRALALRGDQMTLLYQDPFTMLNPLLTAGAHLTEALRAGQRRDHRPSSRAAAAAAIERLAEVGIRDPGVAGRYPFQLSGGMRQRVALATALARDPRLLIADEPSTALDVTTQAEILALLKHVQRQRSMALVLITHDLRVAFSVCDRIYVLYAGSLLEVGRPAAMRRQPLHPYTQGLLLSEPAMDRRMQDLITIPGAVPAPDQVAGCCAFSTRCHWVREECRQPMTLRQVLPQRWSACVRLPEIGSELRIARQVAGQVAGEVAGEVAGGPVGEPAAGTGPLLEIRELRKQFRGRRRSAAAFALAGVDLVIEPGESVGLVGESGSGKTTLGRCVVGLETATSGSVRLGGIDATDYARAGRAGRARLRRTAQIIFQDPYSSLDPKQTVGSAINETLRVNGARRGTELARTAELLEAVGLPSGYASRLPAALSGGERQRVAIARALAVEPRLIVCDEPVSALDVSVQAQILSLLRDIRERTGVAYLFITHDLAVVRQVVDRVYVLYRGEVVEAAAVETVLDSPSHDYTKRLIASIPTADPIPPVEEGP